MNQIIQVSMDKTESYKCRKCKNELFEQVLFLRIVPMTLSPTMKKEIFPVPAYRCSKCKEIADMSLKDTDNPLKIG